MTSHKKTGFRMGIEGWLLVVSAVLLTCAMITPLWNGLAWAVLSVVWLIDVRNWSQLGWFVATMVFLVILLGIQWWSGRKRK